MSDTRPFLKRNLIDNKDKKDSIDESSNIHINLQEERTLSESVTDHDEDVEKAMLREEVTLLKAMSENCSQIFDVLISFFFVAFREINEDGYDLMKLKTIQSVL